MGLSIFNLTSTQKSYLSGQVILPASGTFSIPAVQLVPLSFDPNLLGDIDAGDVGVSDGVRSFSNKDAKELLAVTRETSQKDSDNAAFIRIKQAPTGWTYHMRGVEFKTAALGSTVNQDVDGVALTDSTLRLYNAAGVQITDPLLEGTAVKTVFDLEPTYDYYIIGGICKLLVTPTTDVFISVIAVPDVPFAYGGSRVMIQSVNLKYVTPGDKIDADGRASKGLTYSANHTTKLRFQVLHGAGVQIQLAAFIEMYKV